MKSTNPIAYFTTVIYFLLLLTNIQASLPHDSLCKMLSKSPNFDIEYVLGQPWRYYYTWMLNMEDRCLNIKFTRATKQIIDKVGINMIDYMKDKIQWDEATMVMSISPVVLKTGDKPREVLMFPEKGKPGEFKGVPNVVRNVDFYIPKFSLPTSQHLFKLFQQGKFLVMADCYLGVATLMARANQTIYRSEILSTAGEIWSKEGYSSCWPEKNENEIEGSYSANKIM